MIHDDTHLINQLVALRVKINVDLCVSMGMVEEKQVYYIAYGKMTSI